MKKLTEIDEKDKADISHLFTLSFPNSLGLDGLIQGYTDVGFSILLARLKGKLVFVSVILPKRPTLYLYYVCVDPESRGSGVFKSAFRYLRAMFLRKGFTTFALDASQEDNVPPGITQAKRINIFNRLGFHISPLKNPSPFTENADPHTYVRLAEGTAKLLRRKGPEYTVLLNGAEKTVYLEDIKGCVDELDSSGPGLCAMQTVPVSKVSGGTRKRHRFRKTLRQ